MELDLVLDDVGEQQEQERTVLEFARFHHLCEDYTQEPLFNGIVTPLLDEDIDEDLCDPPNMTCLTNNAHELIKEPIAISKASAALLKSVFLLGKEKDGDFDVDWDGTRRSRGLKLEVPILRSDHELDMLHFGNTAKRTATPSLMDLRIPLEPDPGDDELAWPEQYPTCPVEKDKWVRDESKNLEMKKADLIWLRDVVRDVYTTADCEAIKDELDYQRNTVTEPLTPPLLPLSPPMSPYIPSSPANQLPLLSDGSSSTMAEARTLEDQIMATDSLFELAMNSSDEILPEQIEDVQSSASIDLPRSILKRSIDDLKLETPLTPPMFSDRPTKKFKTVTFADLPDYRKIEARASPSSDGKNKNGSSSSKNGDDMLSSEDDFSGFYKEAEPLIEEANWRIEHEALSEADTTRRMDVPMVDFALPKAPWDIYTRRTEDAKSGQTELDAQCKLIFRAKQALGADSWHGISKLDRELPAAPFPSHSVKVTIEESLHGEDNVQIYISEPTTDDIVTSSAGLWKQEGLRLLNEDEDEEEEEIERFQHLEEGDLDALVRKRKLDMDSAASETKQKRLKLVQNAKPQNYEHPEKVGSPHSEKDLTSQLTKSYRHRQNEKHGEKKKGHLHKAKESDDSLMFGGKFSASNAMDKFMTMQGMEAKPSKSSAQGHTSSHFQTNSMNHLVFSTSQSTGNMYRTNQQEVAPAPLPKLPSIPKDLPPCSFIISFTFLQHRKLAGQIEKFYPDAEFVSRDYDLPRSPSKEADLILSPSTGLILTTLQQLKQRALPGQLDRSEIKERVILLQGRYERLVVMVSEGLSRDMEERGSGRPVDARDLEAITEFENFSSKMEGDVLVRFVAGGDKALARSVVLEMAEYGLPFGSKDIQTIKLLPEETTWELFLRRVGFNPFAAQVILAYLKDHTEYPIALTPGGPVQTLSTFGLQTFLLMPAQKRVENFQAVLGGTRIIRRASALLDGEWVSAVNGYVVGRRR